jgi:dephospho-CoA kinase
MKIAIMGYSGSGKSTLARALAQSFGTPVFHFDAVQFLPGWRIRDEKEKREMTEKFMDENERTLSENPFARKAASKIIVPEKEEKEKVDEQIKEEQTETKEEKTKQDE